jgi:predicted Zn-dependent protease
MNAEELLSGARDAISVRRVFGGGGRDNDGNGGGGFGLAAYVIKDGEVTWKPAVDPIRLALLVLATLALWRHL